MTTPTSDALFSGLLIHTAFVYRRAVGADGQDQKDRFGQPTRNEQFSHVLPCRASRASGGEVMAERSHDVINVNYQVFFGPGVDLREDDVVTVVNVNPATVGDAEDFDLDSADKICERGEIRLVSPAWDGIQEHHREVKVTTQRQAR